MLQEEICRAGPAHRGPASFNGFTLYMPEALWPSFEYNVLALGLSMKTNQPVRAAQSLRADLTLGELMERTDLVSCT